MQQLINFAIPETLLNRVDRFAKKTEKSRSELIREALRLYISSEQERTKQFLKIKLAAQRLNFSESAAENLIEKTRNALDINK